MLHISSLEKLVHQLTKLPGVGPKSAQRLAYFILRSPTEFTKALNEAVERVKKEVHECPECFNFTDQEVCRYCSNFLRNQSMVCVVEEPVDIINIESSGSFHGLYHVLHGAISPLEGIGPQNLKISELIQRIAKKPSIQEVILALDADLEGDTTVLYLTQLLQEKKIKISRIAHGVPIGSDIDYIDDRTMKRALENRVEL